jgi:uncharacterized membrane protein
MDRKEKKEQFEPSRKKSFLPLAVVLLLLVATGAGAWFIQGRSSGPSRVSAQGGEISIPVAKVNDGKAHFFTYASGGTDIRFFVLKSQDGVLRAAFDTCDVCYREKKGYRQQGDVMICNNCDQQFRSDMINEVKGGCNPAPLNRTVAGDRLVIAEADLVRGAWYFK